MQQSDLLRQLAAIVRADHGAACFVVGWLCAAMPEEDLVKLLVATEEARGTDLLPDHYQAFLERWGRLPGPRN